MDYKSKAQSKFMADAQKAYKIPQVEDDGEKVHIPDTLDDSESDSESFANKLQRLTGSKEDVQIDANEKGESSKQIWFMNKEVLENNPIEFLSASKGNSKDECQKRDVQI